ncbi:rCG51782 [Rattus norvegicus]|uniref:RCG51782 n=1 Tax=Rattus norvegicus TaxID=10116 RepID=A6K3N8_RAT|nr:rCG51782 [Rattus norvegicus]
MTPLTSYGITQYPSNGTGMSETTGPVGTLTVSHTCPCHIKLSCHEILSSPLSQVPTRKPIATMAKNPSTAQP